jgi:HAD superfamily hydrolase (TIGR01509 family)
MDEHKGLIFDVDGVIADTEAVNARASIEMFEELFGVKGVRREDFEAGLGRGAEAYVQAAAKVHGLKLTPEQLEEAAQVRQQKFLEILEDEPLPPYPGVLELMEEALAAKDYSVGIATSSTRRKSEAVLKSAKIPYHRMAYISGSQVSRKKPDPQLFQLCADEMNVPNARCLVIEDAPDGVEAALAAGSRCIAVTNSTIADKLATADLVVDSLAEVDLQTVDQLLTGNW